MNEGFFPEKVFKYFEEISMIPRGSGNEQKISNYFVDFARSRGLEVIQDKALNVIIKKPGTKGYESAPTVIIQGHMDMVCDKNKDVDHDFERDPIKLKVDGDMIYAEGTTLGADDGIAPAYGLALLDSGDIPHPPIEVLITTGEETGLNGAAELDGTNLEGSMLINIDSEKEGVFLVSCAGGIRVDHSLHIIWEDAPKNFIPYLVGIGGLNGGHSGSDIHLGRGNSNKLMGRLLNGVYSKIDFLISEINGGSKTNAIPRETDAVIMIDPADESEFLSSVKEWENIFKSEYKTVDPGLFIKAQKIQKDVSRVFAKETTEKTIASLILIPNGVQTMSADIKGLVESSTNLGVVSTTSTKVDFSSSIRSSVRSLKYSILEQSRVTAELLGAEFTPYSDYPEWEYNPDSKLRLLAVHVYEQKYGVKPEITALHAGVECGLFHEKAPGLDMISLGPDMYDVHTTNEHISISSVGRVWDFLLALLKEIR